MALRNVESRFVRFDTFPHRAALRQVLNELCGPPVCWSCPPPGYRPSLMGLLGRCRCFGEASCLHPPWRWNRHNQEAKMYGRSNLRKLCVWGSLRHYHCLRHQHRMVNLEGFDRMWTWPAEGSILAFAWGGWLKPWKSKDGWCSGEYSDQVFP